MVTKVVVLDLPTGQVRRTYTDVDEALKNYNGRLAITKDGEEIASWEQHRVIDITTEVTETPVEPGA